MVSYARSAYGEALRGLRKSLETPAESLSSHVFCAVVLLCMYEVKTFHSEVVHLSVTDHIQLFTDTENPESWMKHAKGLSQLVQIRGPDRYNTKLDITLLKAARGLIVSLNYGILPLISFRSIVKSVATWNRRSYSNR